MSEAVWFHDEHLSYSQLKEQAQDLANLLRRQGNGPVLLYGHKSLSMVISICACLIAGRTYVPVDTCTPTLRIRKIHEMAQATLLLTCDVLPEGLEDLQPASMEELKQYRKDPIVPALFDAPAYLLFTSGSSGEPKGVAVPKESLASFVDWISQEPVFAHFQSIRVLNQASFGFDLSVADLFYSLANGHTLCLLDRQDQADGRMLVSRIRCYDPHMIVATPTFIRLCLLDPDFCASALPSLAAVFLCGEMLDGRTVKRLHTCFPGVHVFNAYGPTEACCAVCGMEITPEMTKQTYLPVGKVGQGAADIRVENGEIVLRGKSVAAGYVNGEPGGFFTEENVRGFRTGDRAQVQNGRLYCLGRMDRQIKFKGFRIELDEIEQALLRLEGVRGCMVQAPRNSAGAVASIVAVVQTDLDEKVLKARLAEQLPDYMMPKQLQVVDQLPVNCSGKADRKGGVSDGCLSDVV